MRKICRVVAGVALSAGCAVLTACADQPPTLASRPGTIQVCEPQSPPGLARQGEFDLSPDGKITVNRQGMNLAR
ncbi:Lipoprotein (plasmid) [Paraburkholderia kururiensis]|uniref:hypothetical protein n=1 Tax=Paraburkholderia kururiensis TaxID=984307 RepID=UPI0039A54075